MEIEKTHEKYLNHLLNGDRTGARCVIEEALQKGLTASSVYTKVIWPMMLEIDKLHRNDVINTAQEALANRINRTIVDQLQNKLPRKESRENRVVICSNVTESAELGAQIMADLFESDGWEVRFLGGTVNNDDILEFVHSYRPDILLIHGIGPDRAPDMRRLIDSVKEVNAFPDMKIMLSGGIFDRAEGLWEEIGADMYAVNAEDAVVKASKDDEDLKSPVRTIKRRKKNQRQLQGVN
jgi:methanogenic corrinoid protein MtbC1